MSRKKKVTVTYSMWQVAKEGDMETIVRDLEKRGLADPADIDDVEWIEEGTKIRYTFFVDLDEDGQVR